MGSTYLNSKPTVDDMIGYQYWMQDLADINREAILANIPTVKADDDGKQIEVKTSKVREEAVTGGSWTQQKF